MTVQRIILRNLFAIMLMASPAFAQPTTPSESSKSSPGESSQNASSQDASSSRASSQDDRRSNMDRNDAATSKTRVVPQGTVTIAADYNNDGRFDRIETIFLVDLKEAQAKSKRRQQQARQQQARQQQTREQSPGDSSQATSSAADREEAASENDQRYRTNRRAITRPRRDQADRNERADRNDRADRDRDERRDRAERGQESTMQSRSMRRSERSPRQSTRNSVANDERVAIFTGSIESMTDLKLAGQDQTLIIAELDPKTGQNVCAVLGPESKLMSWDLSEGDQLTVRGVKARLNDRTIVFADALAHDNQMVTTKLPKPRKMQIARGEIASLQTVQFKGFDQPFLIADIENRDGKTQLVNLGPKSNLRSLQLSSGDALKVLARPGKVGGEQALIAQEILMGKKRVSIPRPEKTRRFKESS